MNDRIDLGNTWYTGKRRGSTGGFTGPRDPFTGSTDPFSDWWATQSPDSFKGSDAPTSQTPGPYGDIFDEYLESEPDIPYQGALSRANLTPNQLLTFRNQRENIFKQFQAQLDDQFRQGLMPTGTATDFFRNFDFQKEFERFGPDQRVGGGTRRFAPSIRVFTDQNRFR